VVGGFVVTDRMLHMFKPKPTERKAPDGDGAASTDGAGKVGDAPGSGAGKPS